MSHQIDAEFIAHNATTDTDSLVAAIRNAHNDVLNYVTGGYEDARCYERFDVALDALAAELGRLQRQQKEA